MDFTTAAGARDTFFRKSKLALGPTQPSLQWVPMAPSGVQAAATWSWPLTIKWCRD